VLAPQLVLAGIATSIAITFNMLLPVVPVLVERRGPHGAAGAATAALFIGAVAGELLTPWLMSRWSSSRLLIAGQLMTAVPSLVYVLPQPDASLMLAARRGPGAGHGRRDRGRGGVGRRADPARSPRARNRLLWSGAERTRHRAALGGRVTARGERVGIDALVAFMVGLGGALLALMLPRTTGPSSQVSSNLLHAFRRPGLLLIFAGFVMVSSSFGAVITFAPVALPATGAGSAAFSFSSPGVRVRPRDGLPACSTIAVRAA